MYPFVARGIDQFHMQHLTQLFCHQWITIGEVGFEIDVFRWPIMLAVGMQVEAFLHHLFIFF